MTMTDTEAKALALVNETSNVRQYMFQRSASSLHEALCRAIEREASTEARHAAELRELKERFSEVAKNLSAQLKKSPDGNVNWMADLLAPFILPAPDPLVELAQEAFSAMLRANSPDGLTEALRAAIEARGGKIVWEKTDA